MSQALSQTPDEPLPVAPAAAGVALLDADGRIEWLNDRLAGLLGLAPEAAVGLTPEQLPGEAATLLEPTGVPTRWPVAGNPWLRVEAVPAGDKRLLIVHDADTEQALRAEIARLREQVEALKLTDDLTGLPNRRAIGQALELQVSRSRRYGNPLGIVLVKVGVADEQVELVGDGADALVLGISRFLRDRLRWVDQIGRWDETEFLLVLPETGREHAEQLVAKIRDELQALRLPGPLAAVPPRLAFGIGIWEKGQDARVLLRRAGEALDAG